MQAQLAALYQINTPYCIDDFLVTDRRVADALASGQMLTDTDETVLLSENEDGVALSVFLDGDLVSRLDNRQQESLDDAMLPDWWTALEGVSHFIYLLRTAERDQTVTLLELELQAEVDKFIAAWRLAHSQDDSALADSLHGWLFDNVSYKSELSGEQHERYRAASDYAGRFCHGLTDRLRAGGQGAIEELRHFYRLSQTHKISHIHACAWGTA